MASDLYEHAIKTELAHWPGVDVEFSDRAKHRQAVFHFRGETRFIVLPATPGDGARGHLNSLRDARKELTALGAARLEKKPGARKRTNRVIGRQMPKPPAWTGHGEMAAVKANPFDALAAISFPPPAVPEPPRVSLWARIWSWITRDSGRHAQRGNPSGVPSEGCQSGGAEGDASPNPSINQETPDAR